MSEPLLPIKISSLPKITILNTYDEVIVNHRSPSGVMVTSRAELGSLSGGLGGVPPNVQDYVDTGDALIQELVAQAWADFRAAIARANLLQSQVKGDLDKVVAQVDAAINSSVNNLRALIGTSATGIQAVIASQSKTIVDSSQALATTISGMIADFKTSLGTATALIVLEQTVRSTADSATATSVTALRSEFNTAASAAASQVGTLSQTIATALGTSATLITGLKSNFSTVAGQLSARITLANLTSASATESFAQQIIGLQSAFTSGQVATNAYLITELNTRSTVDGSMAQQITALNTSFANANVAVNASITNEQLVRSSANASEASTLQVLQTSFQTATTATNVAIVDTRSALSDATHATGTLLSGVLAQFENNSAATRAAFINEQVVRATADLAQSTSITQLSATVGTINATVTTYGSAIANLDGYAESVWGFNVTAGTTVTGMRAIADTGGNSEIIFQADRVIFSDHLIIGKDSISGLIRSNNWNGSDSSNAINAPGTAGWAIDHTGAAVFNEILNAHFDGSLTIESANVVRTTAFDLTNYTSSNSGLPAISVGTGGWTIDVDNKLVAATAWLRNGVVVDGSGLNVGSLTSALRFGGIASGEGIFSKRTSGGNQYGLDFVTNSASRLSIATNGTVTIPGNLVVAGSSYSAPNINNVVITDPGSGGATLTLTQFKTFTVNNTLTLAGTDGTVMLFPSTNATIARTDSAQTFTGTQTFSGNIQAGTQAVNAGSFSVSGGSASYFVNDRDGTSQGWTIYGDGGILRFYSAADRLTIDGSGNVLAGTFNKVTLTQPATGSTLTILNGKTLTANNSIALSGTDGKTLTLTGALSVGADTTISGGGTLALGGFTLTVPATGTVVLTSRTIAEGAGLAGNTYDFSANRTLALGTPSTLTVSTTNSASGTTHTHAITSSSNPGAAASLLATDSAGTITVVKLNKITFTVPATGATLTLLNNTDTTISGGGTLALGGFTLTVPATGTAVLTTRTLTAGTGLTGGGDLSADRTFNVGAGAGITVNADDVALTTPGTLSAASTNSASGSHTHAITSSSNPGAAASILASDSSGFLTLTRLTATDYVFVNNVTANFYLKDTSTGFQAASTTVVTLQSSNTFRSTSYTSGLVGWNISAAGNAEFDNVDIRGAIHASVITYNAVAATAGTLGVFKSAAKLKTDVVVPSSPTYGTTTVNVDVVDADGLSHASSQLFVVGDVLRLKDGLVGDTWLKVSSISDQTTFWRYTCTIQAGTNNVTYRAGLGTADYGLTGNGFIIQTADQTNAPYLQMATHAATFSSADANGSLLVTPQLRLGNLSGSYGYTSAAQVETATVVGTITGSGNATVVVTAAGMSNTPKTVSVAVVNGDSASTAGSKIRTALAADPDVGAFFTISGSTTAIILTSKAVAANDATLNVSIANGTCTGLTAAPTSANTTAGVADTYGLGTGQYGAVSKSWITVDQTNGFRIGNNVTTLANWDTSGDILIGQTGASQSNVSISSGAVKLRNNTTDYISLDTSGNALFGLTSSNQGNVFISGGTVSIRRGTTDYITLSATDAQFTNLIKMTGASAAISLGVTPPTSATAGTGVWLDRNGIYALSSNTQNATLTSAGFISGGGKVKLDAGGLRVVSGTSSSSAIAWQDSVHNDAYTQLQHESDASNSRFFVDVSNSLPGTSTTKEAGIIFTAYGNTGTSYLYIKRTDSARTPSSTGWAEFGGDSTYAGVSIGGVIGAVPTHKLDVYGTGWFQDNVSAPQFRAEGLGTTFASGAGVEIKYGNVLGDAVNRGAVLAYDRGASLYKTLVLSGLDQQFLIGGVERMRLQSGLNVGGTPDPGAGNIWASGELRLSTNNARVNLQRASANYIDFNDSYVLNFRSISPTDTNANIRMSISSIGLAVGANGTPNQAGDIGVARDGSAGTGVIFLGNSGTRYLYYDGSNYYLPGASVIVNGTTYTSSRTVKNNIRDWKPSVTGKRLRPRVFERKEQPGVTELGFVAEEVKESLPEAYREGAGDPNNPKAVKVPGIDPMAIIAKHELEIQDLQDSFHNELAALKAELAALKPK